MSDSKLGVRGVGLLCAWLMLAVVASAGGQTWTAGEVGGASGLRAGAPSNDLCENATEILATPFEEWDINYGSATPDIDVSCNSESCTATEYGVWYTYTPTADCDALFYASTWPETLNLVVAVFTGSSCDKLTEEICLPSEVFTLPLAAGVKYWFLIGNQDDVAPSNTMSFYLTCSAGACCVDQVCTIETPTSCTALGGVYAGDGLPCDPGLCLTGACCYGDGSCVELGGDDCAVSGGTYSGGSTHCTPHLCPQPAPTNDLCELATSIEDLPFADLNVNLPLATPDIDMSCDNKGCTETGYGVWYTYTPAMNSDAIISVFGTTAPEDSAIAVFAGSKCSGLTEVTCSDEEAFSYPLTAGVEYWILVGAQECNSVPKGNLDFYFDCVSGACCLGETCTIEGPTSCAESGGVFLGNGVSCAPGLCETGACCILGGACQISSEGDCAVLGGTYVGGGTSCDPSPCKQQGDTCADPLSIELPLQLTYTDANQTTCGRGNDYMDTCLSPYDLGEDIVYEVTVTTATCVDVEVIGNTPDDYYFGVSIADTCPGGKSCIEAYGSGDGSLVRIIGVLLHPGTYYLMVDSWPPPACLTDFTLTISESTACRAGACCDSKNGCYETFEEICMAGGGTFVGVDSTCDPTDCNTNGMCDLCDIALGGSSDCQDNGIPDECDIENGVSIDGDLNGMPDECDFDCNGNGVPDACELPGGCATGNCGAVYSVACNTGEDCQQNGVLDSCEAGSAATGIEYLHDDGSQEQTIGIPAGAYIAALSSHYVVAGADMINSVSVAWGTVADDVPVTVYVWADPTQDGNPADAYVIGQGSGVTSNGGSDIFNTIALDAPAPVGPEGTLFYVGYSLFTSEFAVAVDNTAPKYYTHWLVANLNYALDPNDLGSLGNSPRLNTIEYYGFAGNLMIRANGIPLGADCNGNGIPDACDVAPICVGGSPTCSEDCNGNLIPDECELSEFDCNGNNLPDDCDIASGFSVDCDKNGIPDDCDLAACDGSLWCLDCNGNNVLDVCDIAECDGSPACMDCNRNGMPDGCDIVNCKGDPWCDDCQGDGIPDGCQLDGSKGRSLLLYEDFESGKIPPTDWTAVANNPFTWEPWIYGPYEGAYLAACQYDSTYAGVQDEWLLTPHYNANGFATLSGYTQGSRDYGWEPNDNYDLEAWIVIGANVNDGDDILLGKLDDLWPKNYEWGAFVFNFEAPSTTFRIGFRYHGIDGAAAGLDLITLDGSSDMPGNDCNGNGVPDDCDLLGDLDGNGAVDYDDYVMFRSAFGGAADGNPACDYCCDYDDSGAVGLADYNTWLAGYRDFIGDPLAGPPSAPGTPQPGLNGQGGVQKKNLPAAESAEAAQPAAGNAQAGGAIKKLSR